MRSCRFVTYAGNARSFPLCSLDIMIMAAVEAYAGLRVGDDSLNALLGSRHASLYPPSRRRTTFHDLHKLCGPAEPHWSMAKIDFTYECSGCGAEIRQTMTKPGLRH